MRSSTVFVLVLAAAATNPALGAPIASPAPGAEDSEAIKLGTVANIASIGSSVVSAFHNLFGKREDIAELLARAAEDDDASAALSTLFRLGKLPILPRDDASDDDSGAAVKLGHVADVASIGSSIANVASTFFGGQKRSDFDKLLRLSDPEIARLHGRPPRAVEDDSEAIKLGTIANIAGIGSSVVSAVHSLFGGQQKREDVLDLLARAMDEDDSAAMIMKPLFTFGPNGQIQYRPPPRFPPGMKIARSDDEDDSAAMLIKPSFSIGPDGQLQYRPPPRIPAGIQIARSEDDEDSGAMVFQPFRVNPDGTITANKYPKFRPGTVIAREEDDEAGAVKLGTIANVAGIGSAIVSAAHSLFGGQQRRADDEDDSGSIVLRPGMQPIKVPHFPGGPQFHILRSDASDEDSAAFALLNRLGGPHHWNARREVFEYLARADTTDESDAIKLSTLGNIASIGGSIISAAHNLFSGNSKRDFEELMARVDEDSEAVKLSTLGNIASIGGSVISAVHNLFSRGDDLQQREFMEILERAVEARSLNELD